MLRMLSLVAAASPSKSAVGSRATRSVMPGALLATTTCPFGRCNPRRCPKSLAARSCHARRRCAASPVVCHAAISSVRAPTGKSPARVMLSSSVWSSGLGMRVAVAPVAARISPRAPRASSPSNGPGKSATTGASSCGVTRSALALSVRTVGMSASFPSA